MKRGRQEAAHIERACHATVHATVLARGLQSTSTPHLIHMPTAFVFGFLGLLSNKPSCPVLAWLPVVAAPEIVKQSQRRSHVVSVTATSAHLTFQGWHVLSGCAGSAWSRCCCRCCRCCCCCHCCLPPQLLLLCPWPFPFPSSAASCWSSGSPGHPTPTPQEAPAET